MINKIKKKINGHFTALKKTAIKTAYLSQVQTVLQQCVQLQNVSHLLDPSTKSHVSLVHLWKQKRLDVKDS